MGANDAVKLVRDQVKPWRHVHAQHTADPITSEISAQVAKLQADKSEMQAAAARTAKDVNRLKYLAGRDHSRATELFQDYKELDRNLHEDRIALARRIASGLDVGLSPEHRTRVAFALLDPLILLTTSPLTSEPDSPEDPPQ